MLAGALFVRGRASPVDYAAAQLGPRAKRAGELAAGIETLSYQFIANPSLNANLDAYGSSAEYYDINPWNTVFSDFLEGMRRAVPELRDAVFFDIDEPGKKPLTMTESMTRSGLAEIRSLVFSESERAGGRNVWNMAEPGAPGSVGTDPEFITLACARLVKRPRDGKNLGVLALLVDSERLARVVTGGSEEDEAPTSPKGAFSILVDDSMRIVIAPNSALAGKPLSAFVVEGLPLQADKSDPTRAAFRETRFADVSDASAAMVGRQPPGAPPRETRPGTLVYARIPESGWFIVTLIPWSSGEFILILFRLSLVLFALLLGLIAFLSISVSRSTSREELAAPDSDHAADSTDRHSEAGRQSREGEETTPGWFAALAPRERRILILLASGMSNKEIAASLQLREQTVKNYISAIYAAIGVQDRVSATLLVEHAGIAGRARGLREEMEIGRKKAI